MTNIVVGNFSKGFENDRPPFIIDNDAFPVINNAYVWRGRVPKKRGTRQLGQLTRLLTTQSAGTYSTINGTNTLAIFTALGLNVDQPNASIVSGDLSNITITFGAPISQTLTDTTGTGTFTVTGAGPIVSATINYATGIITIVGNAAIGPATVTVTLSYYPRLPVMGIRQFNQNFTGASTPDRINFPFYVFFDTRYSYAYNGLTGPFYDINYYFGSGAHFAWSGQDYQQFWTTNYQGAMFATNNVPGLNFVNGTYTSGSGTTTITFNFKSNGVNFTTLVDGDVLWFNEWTSGGVTINNMVGTVTTNTDAANGNYVVTFATSQTVSGTGIAQLMTNSVPGQDGIKYFIGDPIGSPPSPTLTKGWVNFAPPLDNTATPVYLVGAKIIIPFKNRLLFFATWTQTSTTSAIYNPNQLVACQNGTVFYSNTGLPPNQTADPTSFYQNVVGKGIRLNAPLSQEIIVVSPSHDVLVVILEQQPLKLYSTGDDSAPFLYQLISSEFGAQSTFSGVPLDSGVLSLGPYGYAITDQNSAKRIDLQIPDEVFNINQDDHGINRVCAIRDWRNEFVYFTFSTNANSASNNDQLEWKFPTTTLAFNYRDNVWSTFTENYTAYGNFKFSSDYTWATLPYDTWEAWNAPWNLGETQSKYPFIAAGNQQGFVMLREETTTEDYSQFIEAITITGAGNAIVVTITSPNHNLNDGDYIVIQGALGMTNLNGIIFSISAQEANVNTFTLFLTNSQLATPPSGTYIGNGTYKRLTNFNIKTKQFPVAWQNERQTRIGVQRYLFDATAAGQVTVNLYVNESSDLIANTTEYSPYQPYTNIVLTCPEGNSLNLTQVAQDQIWHRLNTSVIGDTVQLEFTLSDAQMRDPDSNEAEMTLYGFMIAVYPGPVLAY